MLVLYLCVLLGNDNQRLGIGTDDPHLNDYLTTLTTADARTGIPGATSGTGSLVLQDIVILFILKEMDTMNQKIFILLYVWVRWTSLLNQITKKDKHHIQIMDPSITVWAPADETLSAGMRACKW